MYKHFFKYIVDFILGLTAFIMLSPVFIVVLIVLTIYNNGKPFFFQTRPGKNEKLFKVIKFKTMNDKKAPDGSLLPDAERITKFGQFVRDKTLDEIPQLINVLKGDMSLVGPRPLLVAYLPLYNEEQKRRHDVKPGITGWAQVNGRNSISWKDKFAYDVYYVDNASFALDLKIMGLTMKKVLASEGVNEQGQATASRFTGEE